MPDRVAPCTESDSLVMFWNTVLLASSIVFNVWRATVSKKSSWPCINCSFMNVLFKILPSSSARRISTSISCEIGAPDDRQYNLSLSGIFYGFVKWDIASMTFFTAHSLFLIWHALRSRYLPDFGHFGSSIMSHISSIFSKSFAHEEVVRQTSAGMLHSSQIYQAVHLKQRTYVQHRT